jgi:hypothetical protein
MKNTIPLTVVVAASAPNVLAVTQIFTKPKKSSGITADDEVDAKVQVDEH